MSDYTPHKWVIARILTDKCEVIYKVFGTWMGGYLDGDSWRMNSGIVEVQRDGDDIDFIGASGSVYHCSIHNKGMSMYTAGVADDIKDRLKELGASFEILSPDQLETYIGSVA